MARHFRTDPIGQGTHADATAGAPAPVDAAAAADTAVVFEAASAFEAGDAVVYAAPAHRRHHSRTLTMALAIALIVAGLAAILYPYASDYLNRLEQSKVAQAQRQTVAQTPSADLSAEWEGARAFNDRLLAGRVVVTDPFDPNNKQPSDQEYLAALNLAGDGVMGELVIPKIDVDLPIYHGVTGEGMLHGVGHMPSTSLPIGGPSTHAVLAGHTGLPSARIFEDLDRLQPGDWFVIRVLGEDHAYRVTGTEVVLPDQTESLAVQESEDLVTLVTCTPYGINAHRLLVHAERCDLPDEWLAEQDDHDVPLVTGGARVPVAVLTLIGLGVGGGLAILCLVRRRRCHPAGKLAHTTRYRRGA